MSESGPGGGLDTIFSIKADKGGRFGLPPSFLGSLLSQMPKTAILAQCPLLILKCVDYWEKATSCFGILGLAAGAGNLVAQALEDLASIPATIILGKCILDAAQIDSTAVGAALGHGLIVDHK